MIIPKTRVKICGLTNGEDVNWAVRYGADALGFILVPSRRYVEPEHVRQMIVHVPAFISTVGVFMDQPFDEVKAAAELAGVDLIQLHGDEDPEYCSKIGKRVIKRIKVTDEDTRDSLIQKMKPYSVAAYLLDKGAGSGELFDWHIAHQIPYPVIVAGGLTPANVKEVVQLLHPYGVDVSSGVEKELRKKDENLIQTFIKEAG